MNQPNLMQRMGATPGKLALIGVLAVVLVTVIVGQLPGTPAPPALALKRPTPSRNQPNHPAAASHRENNQQKNIQDQTKSSTGTREQSSLPRTWPDLSLETIVAFDPFAEPRWLSDARFAAETGDPNSYLMSEAARRARKAEVLAKLREQGTTIVVISAEDKRATIGEQSVRIGDHIEGFLITDITRQGVVLSETEQR